MDISKEELRHIEEEYKAKIDKQLKNFSPEQLQPITTREYNKFKMEYMPKHMNFYERLCNISEKILNLKADKKKIPEIQEAINICHLNVTTSGVASAAIFLPLVIVLLGLLFGFILPMLLSPESQINMFLTLIFLVIAVILIIPLQKFPFFLANRWRMKASNQMVLSVFYIVTYMRHTSNLENAIKFAAEHLNPPLSLDLKKVLWDVETGKYSNIKESLDNYLESWKKWNMEYIESIHLIESSLYEQFEDRRLNALDKALNTILEETYEKMLHYAHSLQGPLTMLHMLGIILPILGLVILPLAVNFIGGIEWYHLMLLYNIILPIIVYYIGKSILTTRPTGYGESDISENNPEIKKYKNIILKWGKEEIKINPLYIAIFVFSLLFFIGILPLIIHSIIPEFDIVINQNGLMLVNVNQQDQIKGSTYQLLGYRTDPQTQKTKGPFGIGSAIISLVLTLSFGIGIGLYYYIKSKNVIKIRNQAKKLEQEFASALFQLGNRIGDGIPAEIAFRKVAIVMQGTISGKFFEIVDLNISKLGMSVEQAIFDPKKGALIYFPSTIIETSMKVLVQSSKKGNIVTSQALINVSTYIKEMHRVDERLKDLMSDIISNMKNQISFLTPAISGIVVGISSMITAILGSLGTQLSQLTSEGGSLPEGGGNIGMVMLEMFGIGVPPYYFQFMVGLYVVQIIFILTVLVNGIQNGSDTLNEHYLLGNNLIKSTITYCIIAFIVMLIFNIIAASIIGNIQIT
ncbi:MAG: hypothetical protein QXG00_01450 [Candidatus Woesearchaeota archaeon]